MGAAKKHKPRILFVTSEVRPFSVTGGLADVSGALPAALAKAGAEVKVVTPLYRQAGEYLDQHPGHYPAESVFHRFDFYNAERSVRYVETRFKGSEAGIAFVDFPLYYDREGIYNIHGFDYEDNFFRFAFLGKAALEYCRRTGWAPDVVHANDWQGAPAVFYLKQEREADPFFADASSLYTFHNLAYQGVFPKESMDGAGLNWSMFTLDGLEKYDAINCMKGGINLADAVNTVSRTYAEEVQTPEQGDGLDGVLRDRSARLSGILNGIDPELWNPATDSALNKNYTPENIKGKASCRRALQEEFGLPKSKKPVVGMVTRLAEQKGLDIMLEGMSEMLSAGIQLVIVGTGELYYHRALQEMADDYPDQLGLFIGFDLNLARRVIAGSDFMLLPSRFEPCGLNQLYAMRYGTVPIVRATGGLRDTVVDYTPAAAKAGRSTGFLFRAYDARSLAGAVRRAVDVYNTEPELMQMLRENGMAQDFSWKSAAKKYMQLYRRLMRERSKAAR